MIWRYDMEVVITVLVILFAYATFKIANSDDRER